MAESQKILLLIVHKRKQSEKNFHNLFEMEKETNPSVVEDEKLRKDVARGAKMEHDIVGGFALTTLISNKNKSIILR